MPSDECFGIWVMIERGSQSVVGDIGFMGPPDTDGSVEVGYSVIPLGAVADTPPRQPERLSRGHSTNRV